MTLEDILELDPTDNFLVEHLADRDPVDDVEGVVMREDPRRSIRCCLIVGFGRSREDAGEERGWTGSRDRAILRMDLEVTSSVGIGFTGEKDAGERWDLGFRSAYLALRDLPFRGECIVGDYEVRAGWGLVFGGPTSMMSIEETARRIDGVAPELLPHRSRDELRYLRGIGIRLAPFIERTIDCLFFVSRRNYASSGDEDAPTLSTNTLFRTEAEIARKDQIHETMLGGRVTIGAEDDVSCGVSVLQTGFAPPLGGRNAGRPAGSRSLVVGVDFSGVWGPFHLRGEVAHSLDGGLGTIVLGALRTGPSLVVLEFQSLSRSFSNQRFEGFVTGALSNETSVKVSTQYVFSSLTNLRGSLCHRWTPSLASGRLSRSVGWSGSLSATLGLGRRWELRCSYRIRQGDDESSISLLAGGTASRYYVNGSEAVRFSLHYHVGSRTEGLTSLETARCVSRIGGETEKGEQMHQEFTWRVARWLALSITVAIFSADSYAARSTSLEDDPISRVRYQSMDGDGFRWGVSITVAPPRTGLSLLVLVARSEQSLRPQFRQVAGGSEWGVRIRWTG